MSYAQILSRAQVGLTAPLVRVEVHLGSGLPTFSIVGLPAPVVRESKERVRAALANCGFEFPAGRITVNLAPADLPKEGGRFDLPIALGILLASGQVQAPAELDSAEFYGELALTGELKPVPGLLLAALHATVAGHALHIPELQLRELRLVDGARLRPLRHLSQLGDDASAPEPGPSSHVVRDLGETPSPVVAAGSPPDLADVRGQHQGCRALLVAAAGGHSLLFCGPPGSGKGMLARRLPGLLPPLSRSEALEVAAIAAVAQQPVGLSMQRPFRCPHHTASAHAIVGGGPLARPGEVSLAHRGVLFLDELPEFDRRVLESLREPLESGSISIARAQQRADFPAAFQLVAAMNPCPCGNAGRKAPPCRCRDGQVQRYRARLSGPLLDRIDLQLLLPPVDPAALLETGSSSIATLSTAEAGGMVHEARNRQLQRQACLNAQLGPEETKVHCSPDRAGMTLLRRVASARGSSARAQHRALRVARTLADLEGLESTGEAQIAEALAMRWND